MIHSEGSLEVDAASWRFLMLSTVAVVTLTAALLVSSRVLNRAYNELYLRSAHLVSRTLIFGCLQLALVLWLLTGVAGLRFHEFGWHRSRIGPGLSTACGIWLAGQLVELVVSIGGGCAPRLSEEWSRGGWVTVVGVLLAQLVGIALAEETFFRGFLLVQLVVKLSRWSPTFALGVGLVVSQFAFAVFHVPNMVLGDSGGVDVRPSAVAVELGLLFVVGVVFGLLYLRTGNLFLVVGVHALQNAGTSIVAPPVDPAQVMFGLSVVFLLLTFVPPIGRLLRSGGESPLSAVRGV